MAAFLNSSQKGNFLIDFFMEIALNGKVIMNMQGHVGLHVPGMALPTRQFANGYCPCHLATAFSTWLTFAKGKSIEKGIWLTSSGFGS